MSLYPGVYAAEVELSAPSVAGSSTAVTGFVGIAPRGPVGVATEVTSWEDYQNKFAGELASPHLSNAFLSYAVEGFFQNAGRGKIYVTRVTDGTHAHASYAYGTVLTVRAIHAGTWGNRLVVNVANVGADRFDVTVKMSGNTLTTYRNLSLVSTNENFMERVINGADTNITVTVTGTTLSVGLGIDQALVGGLDGLTTINDTHYTSALTSFNVADDMRLLVIPESHSATVIAGGIAYVAAREDCVFLINGVENQTISAVTTLRATLSSSYASLYYPWLLVADPISTSASKMRFVPSAGHVAGAIARTHANRSVYKAPAGEETVLRGALGTRFAITDAENGTLNDAEVNAIRSFKNAGIVVWGARTLEPSNKAQKYLNIRLGLNFIKASLKSFLRSAVFEPNNPILWGRLRTAAKAFLLTEYGKGGFKGETPAEAFFVKCDEEINTPTMVKNGHLKLRAGVAIAEPSEFITLEIGQWDGQVVASEQ